jgi:hypothetical protein
VVFSQYSSFLHQNNWMPQYNLNIVESDIKHHNPNPYPKHDVYTPCANINKE